MDAARNTLGETEDLRRELRRDVPGSPIGGELVARYRRNFGLNPDAALTETAVLEHWHRERAFTRDLLAATAEERTLLFPRIYAELYAGLPWLNAAGDKPAPWEEIVAHDILNLLGPSPCRLVELGSGRGRLARRLAEAGHTVQASDVSTERRPAWAGGVERLTWLQLDAVHPDRVVSPGSCEAVLSHQMIEHLHPDDLASHFAAVSRLLAPGGRYIFTTPHAFLGPADLSLVVGADRPLCMHLREYDYGELARVARGAGFATVTAGFRLPIRMAGVLGAESRMRESAAYLRYLLGWERSLRGLRPLRFRRALTRAARLAFFREVPLVATRVS
jgi:SAM-dependent methyltransferase